MPIDFVGDFLGATQKMCKNIEKNMWFCCGLRKKWWSYWKSWDIIGECLFVVRWSKLTCDSWAYFFFLGNNIGFFFWYFNIHSKPFGRVFFLWMIGMRTVLLGSPLYNFTFSVVKRPQAIPEMKNLGKQQKTELTIDVFLQLMIVSYFPWWLKTRIYRWIWRFLIRCQQFLFSSL